MGKALGSKNLMVAFFICNPPPLHGRSYEKSRKMSRDHGQFRSLCVAAVTVKDKHNTVEKFVKIHKKHIQNIKMCMLWSLSQQLYHHRSEI